MSDIKSKPRLTIEVTEEQYNELKKHLPHGMQRQVFSAVINDLIAMYSEFGQHFTLALLQKEISYSSFMHKYAKRNELDKAINSQEVP